MLEKKSKGNYKRSRQRKDEITLYMWLRLLRQYGADFEFHNEKMSKLVVVRSDEMLRRSHRTHRERTRYVRDGGWDVRDVGEVFIARFRRFLFQRVKMIVFALEVFLVEVERLAVLAGLMRATMSAEFVNIHK